MLDFQARATDVIAGVRTTSPGTFERLREPLQTEVRSWRTEMPAKPNRANAPVTALPCGSKISGFGITSTTTRPMPAEFSPARPPLPEER